MSDPDVSSTDDAPPGEEQVHTRAQLLPEEEAAGSDDPQAQARAVLEESQERTDDPDPDASSQSGRRKSEDTL